MMKIDFSGLDPSAPVKRNTDGLDNEILAVPSFKLPTIDDVSLILFNFICFGFLVNIILSGLEWLNFPFCLLSLV